MKKMRSKLHLHKILIFQYVIQTLFIFQKRGISKEEDKKTRMVGKTERIIKIRKEWANLQIKINIKF